MTKQRKNMEETAKMREPLLRARPRVPQRTVPAQSKYSKLLQVIEELGRHLKNCYINHDNPEKFIKVERDIVKACCLVQQCRVEATKNARKACQ